VKAWGYVALVVAVIALLGGTYWLGYSHTKPPVIEQTINEFTVLDSIPASVQTVHIVAPSGEVAQTEYATMDTTLTSPSGNSRVSLGIGYNEYSNLFNLMANFSETIPELSPIPPKAIGFIGAVGIGFRDSLQLRDAELSAGIELREKYSVSLFGRTDRTYGIRFGVRF
jgi:hypothetical protein